VEVPLFLKLFKLHSSAPIPTVDGIDRHVIPTHDLVNLQLYLPLFGGWGCGKIR